MFKLLFRLIYPQIKKEYQNKFKKKSVSKKSFYSSKAWREVRYKALSKFGAKCQCCGKTPKDGVKIHVDHIKPRSKYPELELSLDNLQVLCDDCNIGKLNHSSEDWRET